MLSDRINSGWRTSRTSGPGRAPSIRRSCSTCLAARSLSGRWRHICAPNSCCKHCRWRSGQRTPGSVTHITATSVPIHVDRVQEALGATRRAPVDGKRRRCGAGTDSPRSRRQSNETPRPRSTELDSAPIPVFHDRPRGNGVLVVHNIPVVSARNPLDRSKSIIARTTTR
jgi:hypothetical protein